MTMAIDMLLSAARLRRELGEELFTALVSSNNTAAVRELAEKLVKAALPTEMTVGGRSYDILGILEGEEKSVLGHTMVGRAKEKRAHNGRKERGHLLKHQTEIPAALRGKVVFVFTDDRHPADLEYVYCVCWDGGRWVESWGWLGIHWGDHVRVLRRK
jgi:hypothetical protein